MQEKVLALIAVLTISFEPMAMRDTAAQTASGMQHEHSGGHAGHHMGGPSDGAFHRSFEDAKKWAKEFDDPARDAWQKPEEILDALHLKRTSIVADIGAGTGYFSVRITKRVPEGKVFAADVETDMVRYLGERAQHDHLTNLVPVQASADTPKSARARRCRAHRGYVSPYRQPARIFFQAEVVAASRWPPRDRRLQSGFAEWSTAAVSAFARNSHSGAQRGWVLPRRDPSNLAEAILPRLRKALSVSRAEAP